MSSSLTNVTTKSGRYVKPSLQARESAASKMAEKTLTQPDGVKKTAGRPKKAATTQASKKAGRPRKADATPAVPAKPQPRAPTKRAAAADDSAEEAAAPKRAKKVAQPKTPAIVNQRPTERLNVLVCGEGSSGELGLGAEKNAIDVKRPRLNKNLGPVALGVVQIGTGGMHVAVTTASGAVQTWGVNDNAALGRDTDWEGGMRDMDAESDSDDEDSGLNPKESTPDYVSFPKGVTIVKVSAGDSHTLALTDTGHVYAWGCYRNQSGILGFYQDPSFIQRRSGNTTGKGFIFTQTTPRLYEELKDIVDIKSGANFSMALTLKGQIYIWGCGEQNQLGRHINERIDVESKGCLAPSLLRTGHKKFKAIFNGADHGFAIDTHDNVWSWGLNSFGATGISANAGEDRATVYIPTLVQSLNQDDADPVKFLCGGQHHSIAITQSGTPLIFGRLDGLQTGIDPSTIPDSDVIKDENGNARILIKPTVIPNVGKAAYAACGTDHSIVINTEGKAYTWGISVTYQTGQGTEDDIEEPTLLDNQASKERKFIWCGAGGQYSMFAEVATEENKYKYLSNTQKEALGLTNGVNGVNGQEHDGSEPMDGVVGTSVNDGGAMMSGALKREKASIVAGSQQGEDAMKT